MALSGRDYLKSAAKNVSEILQKPNNKNPDILVINFITGIYNKVLSEQKANKTFTKAEQKNIANLLVLRAESLAKEVKRAAGEFFNSIFDRSSQTVLTAEINNLAYISHGKLSNCAKEIGEIKDDIAAAKLWDSAVIIDKNVEINIYLENFISALLESDDQKVVEILKKFDVERQSISSKNRRVHSDRVHDEDASLDDLKSAAAAAIPKNKFTKKIGRKKSRSAAAQDRDDDDDGLDAGEADSTSMEKEFSQPAAAASRVSTRSGATAERAAAASRKSTHSGATAAMSDAEPTAAAIASRKSTRSGVTAAISNAEPAATASRASTRSEAGAAAMSNAASTTKKFSQPVAPPSKQSTPSGAAAAALDDEESSKVVNRKKVASAAKLDSQPVLIPSSVSTLSSLANIRSSAAAVNKEPERPAITTTKFAVGSATTIPIRARAAIAPIPDSSSAAAKITSADMDKEVIEINSSPILQPAASSSSQAAKNEFRMDDPDLTNKLKQNFGIEYKEGYYEPKVKHSLVLKPNFKLKQKLGSVDSTHAQQFYGVNAAENIARGTVVLEYTGKLIKKQNFKEDAYAVRINKDYLVDAKSEGGFARWINHSDIPNLEWEIDKASQKVYLKVISPIYAGQDLTVSYGDSYSLFKNNKGIKVYLNASHTSLSPAELLNQFKKDYVEVIPSDSIYSSLAALLKINATDKLYIPRSYILGRADYNESLAKRRLADIVFVTDSKEQAYPDQMDLTPFMLACAMGDASNIEKLKSVANFNYQSSDGKIALMYLLESKLSSKEKLDLIKKMYARKYKDLVDSLQLKDKNSNSVIAYCKKNNDQTILEYFSDPKVFLPDAIEFVESELKKPWRTSPLLKKTHSPVDLTDDTKVASPGSGGRALSPLSLNASNPIESKENSGQALPSALGAAGVAIESPTATKDDKDYSLSSSASSSSSAAASQADYDSFSTQGRRKRRPKKQEADFDYGEEEEVSKVKRPYKKRKNQAAAAAASTSASDDYAAAAAAPEAEHAESAAAGADNSADNKLTQDEKDTLAIRNIFQAIKETKAMKRKPNSHYIRAELAKVTDINKVVDGNTLFEIAVFWRMQGLIDLLLQKKAIYSLEIQDYYNTQRILDFIKEKECSVGVGGTYLFSNPEDLKFINDALALIKNVNLLIFDHDEGDSVIANSLITRFRANESLNRFLLLLAAKGAHPWVANNSFTFTYNTPSGAFPSARGPAYVQHSHVIPGIAISKAPRSNFFTGFIDLKSTTHVVFNPKLQKDIEEDENKARAFFQKQMK